MSVKEKKTKEKPQYNTWQNICYVVKGAWKHDRIIFLYFSIFTISSGISPFVGIIFPRFILQELMNGKSIKILALLLLGFFVLSSIFGFSNAYVKQIYFPRLVNVRFMFIRQHQLKCMTTDFQNTENPDFLNEKETAFRCLQDNQNGIEGMMHKLFSLGGNILALFGYIAIISTLSKYVLLYLLANVLLSYLLTYYVKRYEHSKKDEISENDRKSWYIYDLMYNFGYGKELRIFNLSQWFSNLFKDYKQRRLEIHKNIKWKYFMVGLIDVVLLIIREGVIYAYLIYLVLKGRLSIPDSTMYFLTIASFATWLNTIIYDFAHIRAQNLYICDYRKFIEQADIQEEHALPLPQGPYEIEFINVSFHYPNSENYIFKDLNLKIPFEQKLAIVGHNGAGKTTLIKLLCRLYDVTEGEIRLNGINIKQFSKEEYATLFSTVFQEVKILAFPVSENVAIEEKDFVDMDKLNQSIFQAGIKEKVSTLKKGLDTSLLKILDEDGIELSGGEKQKISMARALYKDAPFMVLDEPTAAMDALSEYQTYLDFDQMVQNKTAIYISHRLASTQFCDTIAMFEHGKIVEYGSHEDLLSQNGKYADMFETQARYYKESEEATA